jgi:S1-C subfamily serine protease
VVDDGIVLTSAHTLRGARSITVSRDGHDVDATIVAFDPDLDLAYLRADVTGVRPIPVDSSGVEPGRSATAWVVRGDEVLAVPVTIRRRIRLNTEDIYVDTDTTRPGVELHADIEPGDSGGPIVVDGGVAALLWARSKRTESRAYAIDPDRGRTRIDGQLAAGDLGDVDLMRCR